MDAQIFDCGNSFDHSIVSAECGQVIEIGRRIFLGGNVIRIALVVGIGTGQ